MRSATDPVQFGPIRQPRSHEYVGEQIRRHIDLRLIPPGWALPAERDLAQQFGVGRATVQLALRELELEHLVEVRRGRRGGTFVTHHTDDNRAYEAVIERILGQGQALEELLEYRSVLEPEVAQVAAQARSEDDLGVMGRAIEGMKRRVSEPEYMRHDSEFHLALAAATDNRFMVEAIDANRRQLGDLTSLLPESDAWHERNNQEHEAVLRAVADRNPAAARGAMELHVANAAQSARAVLAAIRRRARDRAREGRR
jgi:DNA-binding FadR family transcriptional regulator